MSAKKLAFKSLSSELTFIIFLLNCLCSCKPIIHSFKVTTHDTTEVRRITSDDTLHVNWNVVGKPTLLVHETGLPDSAGKVLEMTMVAEKGGKEVIRTIQVEILSKSSATAITFNTRLSGDTLIAEGDKNPGVWGDRFAISSVSNTSRRSLSVWHANRTTYLDKGQTLSAEFEGTPVEGRWVFKSVLTNSEKVDHSSLPDRLSINATITYKRR